MKPTKTTESLAEIVSSHVESKRDRLTGILRDLIQIPSENTAPIGAEKECQAYVERFLSRIGWAPAVYSLDSVPGLKTHPLYWPGRDYRDRPNLGARRAGAGGGHSLVLSGHIDTVPRGSRPWTRDPFGGQIEGNRLFGRGANDMKGGVATNLFVAEAVEELGLKLKGDLIVETVVDEEFGGSNGTLAGRLMGFNADAAIISEPSFLRICAGQRGGRIVHIKLMARPGGGVLTEGQLPVGIIDQLHVFLGAVKEFAARRKSTAPVHELYAHSADPVPVSITRISTGPWGTSEPTAIPAECRIEMYWQAMPGEDLVSIDAQFHNWIDDLVKQHPDVFRIRPEVEFPIRWLPGSAVPVSLPIVEELKGCAKEILQHDVPVAGIEGPCDLFVFQQGFGIPAVLWGARGGNTHDPDEYVEIDSLVAAARVLLLFVCRWCEV